jgi:hypothetical protein
MDYDADEEEEEELVGEYTHVTLQLLDLMHTLHTRAAGVHQVLPELDPDSYAS